MKFIKKNIKLIIGIIVGMILVSSISVYAAYNYLASDVSYTKADGTKLSVQDALIELYNIKESKPQLEKIYSLNANEEINYNYNLTKSGKYLVGIMQGNPSYFPSINTDGNIIFNTTIKDSSSTRTCLLYLIDGEKGNYIKINGQKHETWYSTAFIYEVKNINVYHIYNSKITYDSSATLTYTASKDNDKVMFVALNNGDVNKEKVNITYSNKNTNYIKSDKNDEKCIYIGYAILSKGDQISLDSYGYCWGGGAIFIIK